MLDSPIMHYVNFLVSRGFQPYRDISDNNLPGAYMTEWVAVHLFGVGDLAWRWYEFCLLGSLTAALAVLAKPVDWMAGLFAGLTFVLLHGTEGPGFAGERELLMSALVLAGLAWLCTAVRRHQPFWMLPMGFAVSFAASIKPTIAPLFFLYLATACVVLRRRRLPVGAPVAWAVLGGSIAVAVNVAYLTLHHAWHDFSTVQRLTTLAYANLANAGWLRLTLYFLSNRLVLPFLAAGLALALLQRRWDWERWLLLATALVGLLSYYQQRKPFVHHLYLYLLAALLLVWLEATRAWREQTRLRWVATACALYTALILVPLTVRHIRRVKPASDLTLAMMRDLRTLGGPARLQGRVQCLDMVFGCLNALYHEGIVGNTGSTGDLLIFHPAVNPAVERERTRWWTAQQQHPPDLLFMTNEYFQGSNTYAKVENWPAYAQLIGSQYTLIAERAFPNEYAPFFYFPRGQEIGYRIYRRNGFAAPPLPDGELGPE